MSPIIERNSVLPISRVERYWTVHQFQEYRDITILQVGGTDMQTRIWSSAYPCAESRCKKRGSEGSGGCPIYL